MPPHILCMLRSLQCEYFTLAGVHTAASFRSAAGSRRHPCFQHALHTALQVVTVGWRPCCSTSLKSCKSSIAIPDFLFALVAATLAHFGLASTLQHPLDELQGFQCQRMLPVCLGYCGVDSSLDWSLRRRNSWRSCKASVASPCSKCTDHRIVGGP